MSNTKKIISQSFFWLGVIFTFIISFFCSFAVLAQETAKYQILNIAFPGTNIRCMTEDRKGFLWIGTQDGLFRFDSKVTKEYNKNSPPGSRIGGSDIRAICEEGNNMWVTSTQGGINDVNTTTSNNAITISQNKFPGLENGTITSLLFSGTLFYIGTERGLYSYDKVTGNISRFKLNKRPVDSYIDKITVYKKYLIIFFRNWGLQSYNLQTGELIDSLKTIKISPEEYRFYSLVGYGDNKYLSGTSKGIKEININAAGLLEINDEPFKNVKESLNNDIYAISVDKTKKIWFSTENQLINIDAEKNSYTIVANALENKIEFLNNVYNIYCDEKNNIWLGCQTGLFMLKNEKPSTIIYHHSKNGIFKIPHAYYLFPANDSILFVTAENGLYKVNKNSDEIKEIDVTQSYDFVFKDPYNKTIVAGKPGLLCMKNDVLYPIKNFYKEFEKFPDFTINSAIVINDAEIVMGSENNKGILVWNFIKHTVVNFTTSSDVLKLESNIINSVFKIAENIFCVLSESSLIYIDYNKKTSKRIHFQKDTSDEEYAFFFDMCRIRNHYYLSSYGNGILELDTMFKIKRVISSANGLSNSSIYKLLPWKDSLLFMTTNFGLNILDVKSGRIKKIFKSDGLHDDVFEETSGNIYKNIIYAGGPNGFTGIYPENIKVNQFPPLCFINRISVELPGQYRIDTSDLEATLFSIPNNVLQTNVFFSGINYSNPARTTFSYKIKEIHKDWINLDVQNFVTLIGIAPGTYHLQVKAANEDGVWSEPKELILIFLPKWYQTWWFKLLVFLSTAGIIYAFYRYRIRQIEKQHAIRKNIATDLHDDLGSTLNSVKIFTNLAISGIKQDESLQQVKDNLNEATMGLRDMIWVLDDSLDTVDELVTRLKQYAIPVAAAANIVANIKADTEVNCRYLTKEEKRNLFLICKESINNSIKYSQASEVNVRISAFRKKIQIIITDNGKGFNVNEVKKGYGLKNIQYRSGQIKYSVIVTSFPGNGTKIEISPS
ncbi:MAG TPA: two-component regulator propeller domain-containing protein [Ferruginibacter sp.]|nr:two-component regulator propeller domain-containing protein [Ferruginibacter sp.]